MQGYNSLIEELTGLSKISIQTGTSHGGVVLPDGSIADVKIDFDTLKVLSKIARNKFKMAGAVQHGASTLPKNAFSHFPDAECAEIHLATQFQNIIYEFFPDSFKEEIYSWIHKNLPDERVCDQTDEQFIYKTRKKALGPFKRQIHSLPHDLKDEISSALEKEVCFLFEKLNIKETRSLIAEYVNPIWTNKKKDDFIDSFLSS
jgi:hypothetical protein